MVEDNQAHKRETGLSPSETRYPNRWRSYGRALGLAAERIKAPIAFDPGRCVLFDPTGGLFCKNKLNAW
jgi:hypothetical protein